jgi:hypothetical protein
LLSQVLQPTGEHPVGAVIVVALDGQGGNARILQLLQTELGLVEDGRLNGAVLEEVTTDQHKVDLGLYSMTLQHIVQGKVKVLGTGAIVVAIEAEVNIRDVEKPGHGLCKF